MAWRSYFQTWPLSLKKQKTKKSQQHSTQQEQHQQQQTTLTLYHQTSPEIARAILATGQMKPGIKGYGGAGIYFALSPQETSCKATKKGVILECEVQLGTVKEVKQSGNWSGRLWQWWYAYDSIKITNLCDGVEFVVFDPAHVKKVRLWKPGVSAEVALVVLAVLLQDAAWLVQCMMCSMLQTLQACAVLQQSPCSMGKC